MSDAAIKTVESYLRLIETFSTDREAYEQLLHPEARFVVHPNLIDPNGSERDLDAALGGVAVGRALLQHQQFDLTGTVSDGTRVVVEAIWTGTVAIDTAKLTRGQSLRAHICMVFELEDGRIRHQRNYDCYGAL